MMQAFFVGMAVLVISGTIVSVCLDRWPKGGNAALLGAILFLYYLGWDRVSNWEEGGNILGSIFLGILELGFGIPLMGMTELGEITLSFFKLGSDGL